jgi:polyferredoxin
MDKMGYERNLVKYTTENAIEGKKTHLLRPRVIIYFVILLAITAALIYSMATRIPLELDIIRDRNALYRTTSEGMVENIYTLKISNMDRVAHTYSIAFDSDFSIKPILRKSQVTVESGKVANLSLRIQADPVDLKSISQDVHITIKSLNNDKLTVTEQGVFLGPGGR